MVDRSYDPWLIHLRQECEPDCHYCAEESQQVLLETFYGEELDDWHDLGGEG